MKGLKMLSVLLLAGIFAASVFFAAAQATAASNPDEFNSLTGEWGQWSSSIPVSVNPLLDTTGVDCMVGQRGSIWFLGGTFNGGSATRKCSIPADKKLFFPVINTANINTPNVCGQGSGDISVDVLRSQVAPFIDNATKLSAKLDGKPQPMTRVKSDVFDVALPGDNIFNAPCGGPGTVPAGVYSPAIDDGYYVMLDPLSTGEHTLKIHAESGTFTLDVKYDLNVVRVQLE